MSHYLHALTTYSL